ncbi:MULTISPECIES: hypothetical protein [unclassified Streptomyces]|uniref:hypothetical protein n=1 Tax=unclassified Streptomyces TaxID=2593676 RepID=UPI003D7386D0
MRGHTRTSTVALCAALGLAASLGAATASPKAPAARATAPSVAASAAGRTVLVDCLGHPRVRPGEFVLACGDGNSRLASLRWKRWDADVAVATGVNWLNDCDPYCAAGTFHAYPVTVRLDRPQSWKTHPEQRRYGRIGLTYTEQRPDGTARTVSLPLMG